MAESIRRRHATRTWCARHGLLLYIAAVVTVALALQLLAQDGIHRLLWGS